MLHTVTEREFKDLMLEKEFANDSRKPIAVAAYAALFTGYADKLTVIEITLMGFLIARTLAVGRRAQRIATVEFIQGTREQGIQVACGLPVGRTAIRDHLKKLADSELLQIYRTVSGNDEVEKESRMFEIDCKNLMDYEFPPEERTYLGGRETDPRGRQATSPSYINSIDSINIVNKDKSLYSARDSRIQGARKITMFAIPKKPRATVVRSDSIADVLATVNAKHSTARVTRAASAAAKAPHHIDKQEMQALIDATQKAYAPDATRVVVTGKEFGVLRKRLRDQPPADFKGFIEWLVRYWSTIAHQNRVAVRRNEDRAAKGDRGLPMAMDFATLAYRYPYFVKAYANFRAERTTLDIEAKDDKAVRLQKQLDDKDRDIATMRRELVRAKTIHRTRPARLAPRVVPIPTEVAVELDSAELPEWESRNTFGAKRNAK